MPRPRERSASLEIIPPTNTRPPGLADVMAAAFHANHRENEASDSRDMDEEEDADAEAEADEIDDEPAQEHPKEDSASKAPPPKGPMRCERCVRTNKPCGGTFGERCDNCKRLKQKCSNNVGGPVRGKGYYKSANRTADQSKNGEANSKAGPSTAPKAGIKRKGTPAVNGDVDGHSADGEGSIDEESGQQSGRQRKKRRSSNGLTHAQLVKAVNDMEGAMNRIKASVGKELDKMHGIINTLNSKIRDMEEA